MRSSRRAIPGMAVESDATRPNREENAHANEPISTRYALLDWSLWYRQRQLWEPFGFHTRPARLEGSDARAIIRAPGGRPPMDGSAVATRGSRVRPPRSRK